MKTKEINLETGVSRFYPSTKNIDNVIVRAEQTYKFLAKDLKERHKTLHIICKGTSGLMLATIVAERFWNDRGEDLSVIISFDNRGAHTTAHGSTMYRTEKTSTYFCIMDDFVCSGQTIEKIKEYIQERFDSVTIDSLIVRCGGWQMVNDGYHSLTDKNFRIRKAVNLNGVD